MFLTITARHSPAADIGCLSNVLSSRPSSRSEPECDVGPDRPVSTQENCAKIRLVLGLLCTNAGADIWIPLRCREVSGGREIGTVTPHSSCLTPVLPTADYCSQLKSRSRATSSGKP